MGRVVSRLLLPALVLLTFAACGPGPEPRLVRLADLVRDTEPAEPRTVAQGVALGAEPSLVAENLDAARLTRLTVQVEGDATELVVAWKVLGDARFEAYRRVTLPLAGDGAAHSYEVDLDRNPYWSGTLPSLALSATGGAATLVRLVAHPAPDRSRDVALAGTTLPSLPAVTHLEMPLPDDLPETGRLSLSLGLLPDMDRPDTTARFRIVARGTDGGEEVWLDQTVTGGDAGRSGWRPVDRVVTIPAGGTLVLEASAERGGRPLPEGVAFWGAPRLMTGSPTKARRRDRTARNLLVVNIDTLRADALGSYGSPDRAAETPHLDALAGRGVRFATHRAAAPWTLPSVATLLTGLQPQTHRTGIRVGGFTPTSLPESADTLAERLAARGFVTSGLYNNIYLSPAFRVHQGFDRWQSMEQADDVLVERAIEQLAGLGEERFFYYLHLFGPHNPYEPPDEDCARVAVGPLAADRERLGCGADRRPGNPLTPVRDRAWLEALYRAEVSATDRALGRLFAFLEESGRADDTLVLVVSDHGEDFWEHLGQMRRRKGYRAVSDHGHSFYEELLAVPGILAGPGVEAGMVWTEPVESVDFYPTVLGLLGVDLGGAPAEVGLQGRDLVPLLSGRPPQRPTLVADNVLYGLDRWSVRRGPWKLVVPEGYDPDSPPGDGAAAPELYHLERDPGETDDRSRAEPEVVRALFSLGSEERAARRKSALGEGAAATYLEWNHVTKLRSLGYLQ
jgi:arylsulfatase A-like enzyme